MSVTDEVEGSGATNGATNVSASASVAPAVVAMSTPQVEMRR